MCDSHCNSPVDLAETCSVATPAAIDFMAGRLKLFKHKWMRYTSDAFILECVAGCRIEFVTQPVQLGFSKGIKFSGRESDIVDSEIYKLITKGVICISQHEEGEFISPIFTRPKKSGSHRVILNLEKLNKNVACHHFKMDTVATCISLIKRNCFMTSIDLQDAYFTVPVDPRFQKFLKFFWRGILYQFTCLPNGLACAPRIFTKILKPISAFLRSVGHVSSFYLDDVWLVGDTYDECAKNTADTLTSLTDVGFIIHDKKSNTKPSQIIEHLGFQFNSADMTVKVSNDKIEKIRSKSNIILKSSSSSIREVAQLIGTMVSCFHGVEYGPLFYRRLEIEKALALRQHKGDFDKPMTLAEGARQDILWWTKNVQNGKLISHGNPDYVFNTDASLLGWGAVLNEQCTGGRWKDEESRASINVLELQAVSLGLKALCSHLHNSHIQVLIDNTTAVAYINHMGGSHSVPCNDTTRDIWLWCIERRIWLSAAHIPGVLNVEADRESRIFSDQTEWRLDTLVFEAVTDRLGLPNIDLFASRLNFQCKTFVAWHPDPEAFAIDAFKVNWTYLNFYAFPPFSLIPRVLQKICEDQADGILIAPCWPTQSWFPRLLRMLTQPPILLPRKPDLLTLSHDRLQRHPLRAKMELMACQLSGKDCRSEAFRKTLKISSYSHGEAGPRNSMTDTSRNGRCFVVNGAPIQFMPL